LDVLEQADLYEDAEAAARPLQNPQIIVLQAIDPAAAIGLPLKIGEEKHPVDQPPLQVECLDTIRREHLGAHPVIGAI
jgi:hypothetical protein